MMRPLVLAAVVAFAAGGCGGGASDKPGDQPTKAAPESSGLGGRIVVRRFLDDGETTATLYIVNADGTGEKRLTKPVTGVIDDEPDWAPDGTSLVFTRITAGADGAESHALFTTSANGSAPTQLSTSHAPDGNTAIAGWDAQPAFSPDGKTIAFAH